MPKAQLVEQVMTRTPQVVEVSEKIRTAASLMAKANIGAVIVTKEGALCGILTDRDIVIRCVARGGDCDQTTVGEICSQQLATLSAEDTVDNAIALMAKKAIRRIPVVDGSKRPVGIVSLGDLAQNRDPKSALGGISASSPNA
jgi:CBS domain-containing protein